MLYLILVSLAVAPAFVLGQGNRNLLLIGVMGLSPLVVIAIPKFYKSDIWLLLFMASIIVIPLVHQPEHMRWSTVLYSCMFCGAFMAYNRLLHVNSFKVEQYRDLLKYLIYAYFIVLLIQQFCVLTGLPVFNASNYNSETPWTLNALAAEPSHSARIVALLMYCYITVRELILDRAYKLTLDVYNDRWVWMGFLWTMVTMGSATGFLFIIIVLLKFMRLRNLIPLAGVLGLIVLIINWMGVEAYKRTWDTFVATLSLDIQAIIQADLSASFRIVPFIVLSRMIDVTTLNGWFGHGIDHVSTFLSTIIPASPEGLTGGGLLQVWINFGFLSFALFFVFSLMSTFNKSDYLSLLFWVLLVFMYGINNQIVWLCIVLLYTNRFFSKNYHK
ncbi:hypothetical protein ACG2F4_17825 [Halalkalibaculum sp. DA3122]|uniref:hypothetical protein n=1 Tax=Halalkalibaculum sp. DA3122 TaxID=3373607 RepID=UPI00375500FA